MEILKGVFDEYKYDKERMCEVKVKSYHIYLNGTVVHVSAPFPVHHMKTLRQLVSGLNVTNIIVGDPDL